MGVIGTAVGIALPTPGVTAGPQWASDLNTFLTEVKTRLESLINSSSITLTTGDVIHGSRTINLAAAAGQSGGATWTKGTGASAGYWLGAAAADTVELPIPLEVNQRLTAVRITGRSVGTAWTGRLWKIDTSAGTRTQVGATLTSNILTSIEELAITGLTETVANNIHYIIEWTAGAALTRFLGAEAVYDRTVAT